MQLIELLADVEVLSCDGDERVEVLNLTHDSRVVEPGDCFACIPGATIDGHDHAPEAVRAGAAALLVERQLGLGVPEARVASVREALGPAAAHLHGAPSAAMRCVGITGTNGKTTVTYLLEAMARAGGSRVGVVGTTGARIDGAELAPDQYGGHTTPEATELQALLARMRDAEVDIVAMEVSSHALVQQRIDGTQFAAACFTNLSHDHLDFHGDLGTYFEAKASLFDPTHTAHVVTNLDDRYGIEIARRAANSGLPVITFGLHHPEARLGVLPAGAAEYAGGTSFYLVDDETGDSEMVHSPLIGQANLSNALAAAASARAIGVAWDAVVAGLTNAPLVPGRLEPIDVGQPFTVLVDYAHTPAALTAALRAAHWVARGGRVVLVFGCGGDRDQSKRPLMGEAAARADEILLTSDNPRSEDPAQIADEVLRGIRDAPIFDPAPVTVELDRRMAIRLALARASDGDVVLVAGKGHEAVQIASGTTVPFDDRAVVREELGAAGWN